MVARRADRPILFRDDMVRAILASAKTVTRRVGPTWARVQPGERLWVRETFALPASCDALSPTDVADKAIGAGYSGRWAPIWRRADETYNHAVSRAEAERDWGGRGKWRPNIHMPRWACRLELEVVSVTPEPWGFARNGMTTDEARREGFHQAEDFIALWCAMHPDHFDTVYRVEFRRSEVADVR